MAERDAFHLTAEEYDEAYISIDPARRARSEAVWVETAERFRDQGDAR